MPARSSRRTRLNEATEKVREWFARREWAPFPFQEKLWNAYLRGESGLLHSTTGSGKTFAVWFGPVIEAMANSGSRKKGTTGLQVLWITPLRALAADTLSTLQITIDELHLPWTLEGRTGDTPPAIRRKQQKRLPEAMITTPESLSLLLTRRDASTLFTNLKMVVVDEWHELLSTKRGVQVELGLARLARWAPAMRVWGVSATLGNLEEAREVLLRPLGNETGVKSSEKQSPSPRPSPPLESQSRDEVPLRGRGRSLASTAGRILQGATRRETLIESVLPKEIERFPWAGHLGLKLLPQVLPTLEASKSTLLFTNTRSHAEIWYQAILKARPDWAGLIGLHHGSLDRSTREWVERGLKTGHVRCAVCTSSLDLGVDFTPVDQVVQVGSPKGVARLLQRAGRSGHQPGASGRLLFVPTNALELLEIAAVRDAIKAGHLEGREPVEDPIDILVQHAVTIAAGDGFEADDLYNELRSTHAFQDLAREDWQWVLDFVTHGGETLKAYPDYHRVKVEDGKFVIANERIARQHRAQVGTIVSDASLRVKYLTGGWLGTIEESFIAKLKPGDSFTFAGRVLELIKVHGMDVFVRLGSAKSGVVPRWMGGRLPLSTELSAALRQKLDEASRGEFDGPEMRAVAPLLNLQGRWSRVPAVNELLVERWRSREGHHLFVYPFAGRLVHEGLAALWAYRLSRRIPNTFSMSVNDYGVELLSPHDAALDPELAALLLDTTDLAGDLAASLNNVEMARRQFREVARIAGLVFEGYAGQRKTAKQLQASSGLLYDVFTNYDPSNLLLHQAKREVLERQLESSRLKRTLDQLGRANVTIHHLSRPTPLAFPLVVDRLRDRLSSETLTQRIQRMTAQLEKEAGQP
ncbi:DNA ligase-associated DEXH box helicase [Planctomyces sp. SCGC AG-212-M04]|nr:DNA ligase-associated DEXH box helicase [Planctomyces sp. SCGC AG-212-M04]